MEQRSALPSLNGKIPDQPLALRAQVPVSRPTSSGATGGRRALGILPKSAGATSASQRARHSDGAVASPWHLYDSQAQRPSLTLASSTRVAADRMVVRVFTSAMRQAGEDNRFRHSQQQDEHCKGPEGGDSRDELQQLRDENDALRTKLVAKMRGQSKVVAGGQFRAASGATPAKAPATPKLACTKCATARARALKAHQESAEAQAATAALRKHVDKIEAAQQRLWEERSTHVSEVARLREKLAQKVEECVLIEAECTKLGNQVKTLQPETDLDEVFSQQVEQKEVVDEATQCTLQQSCDDEIRAAQLHEIATLKAEVRLLVQQLDARDQEVMALAKDLQEAQTNAAGEKLQHERVLQSRLDEDATHKRRISELEHSLEGTGLTLETRRRTHQKELRLLQEDNAELRKEVAAQDCAARVQEQLHKDEASAREQQHQTLVKALKVRIEQKVADVDRLHALVAEHAAEKASSAAMKQQISELGLELQTLVQENARLVADQARQQQEAEAIARAEREQLHAEGEADQRRATEALGAAEQETRSLQTRVTEVEAELADQLSLMQKQKRSHARALERLLESSLRLCVVAPTVNVQLNTNGSSLAAKANSSPTANDASGPMSVTCRSTPQHASIKRVIESDVLPLFTTVFLQGDGDASPQATVPMTRWLQDLLHDMQARIAAQLESIYSTASTSGE